ncbi:copper amine oxidase N-terminal domain-containing protein [Brevibacillus sp. NRS-1366]|uniref:copper amine oxidase N-terminal domain-containing protein n=1 Tax=Brevibacillus sp. NRS-1366 TaxID=3233899 RepID=UPI003D2485CC
MFLKKWGLLLLAAVFVLTGCANEASLVGDAVVASIEKPNYDFKSSIKLTGNFDNLAGLAKEQKEDGMELTALLKAMKEGLTIQGSTIDANTAKMVVTLNDDKLLRDNNLWSDKKKASLEILLDKNNLYVTTPMDKKYLAVDNSSLPGEAGIDQAKLAEFQEKMNKLTMDFFKKYVSTFGFKLSHAKNHGSTTVQLPNGQHVKATHVSITLDTKELIKLGLFIAKDATTNKEVKKFAVDLVALMNKYADESNPDGKVKTNAEYMAQAKKEVEKALAELKKELKMNEKTYTPDVLVEKAKQEGLQSVSLKLDYYIDKNKMPVRTTSNLSISVNNVPELKKPLTFGLQSDAYAWNFGKATSFTIPAQKNVVTARQIMENKKRINDFNKKGFLYAMLREMNKETVFIFLDLKEKSASVNGEPVKNVHPYQTKGTVMVPFRFIGEAMGANVEYKVKTKTAVYTKDKTRIEVAVGSNVAKVNGIRKKLSTPVSMLKGKVYVPLRFVSEQLGAKVDWIDSEKQAIIEFDKYE